MNVREFGQDEGTCLISLNTGLFRSILNRNLSSVSAIISSVQLAHQWRMAIFIEGEEEVGIPTMVEGRPYPMGGFPKMWKQEAKGGRPWLFSRTTPYDSSTNLL